MNQNNDQYSNSNAVKNILLILVLIGGIGYLIYNGTLFGGSTKRTERDTNPLSCVRTSTSEMNGMKDEYRYERNITFDENGKVDNIEFIGTVRLNKYNLAYNDAKNKTWTPDLVTNDCEQFGMKVNTILNDQLREIKSVCNGNYATIDWQDSWKNTIGTTREEIKNNFVDDDYECN